jgi:hypothetical protein
VRKVLHRQLQTETVIVEQLAESQISPLVVAVAVMGKALQKA